MLESATKVDERAISEQAERESLADTTVRIFREDFTVLLEKLKKEKNNDPEKDQFRCLLCLNPDGKHDKLPIVLTIPNTVPKGEVKDMFGDTLDTSPPHIKHLFHSDINAYWRHLVKEDPTSERAGIIKRIDEDAGGYDQMAHGYVYVREGKNGQPIVFLEYGWTSLTWGLEDDVKKKLLLEMNKYGFDEIAVRTNDEEEVVQVEQLILEEMMTSTIEENAKKLSKVVSSRSVTLYKKMAVFFMTTPNASMTSAVHGRYQQYQELLAKL